MKSERNLLTSIIVAFFVLTLVASTALAVPPTINYQGRLADSGGVPVNATLSMTFAIYNTPTDGAPLWSETQSNVTVTDGAFSVVLGSIYPITLPFDEQYYLGVQVDTDGEMSPRAVLVSVPYAMRAADVDDGVVTSDKIAEDLLAMLDARYVIRPAITTVDVGGVGTYTSIAIGGDGLPVISYHDHINADLKIALCRDASCLLDNIITTMDDTGDVGRYTSVAIGDDGYPVISYQDITNSDLKVAKCDDAYCFSRGNNTVDAVGDVGWYTSIAIGADGLPVISYYDQTNNTLKVAKCGDADCFTGNTITTVDSAGNVGGYTSIARGADGLPVISYYDTTNSALKVAHCGIANCTSGNTITTVDSEGSVGRFTSIAIGADGLPVISYFDNTNLALKVAKCGDASCTTGNTITAVGYADSTIDEGYTSIAVGGDGLPVIASYTGTFFPGLKVTKCGDASCSAGNTFTIADSAGSVGSYASIAVGGDGLPVISYWDFSNSALKVARCRDDSCSVW